MSGRTKNQSRLGLCVRLSVCEVDISDENDEIIHGIELIEIDLTETDMYR